MGWITNLLFGGTKKDQSIRIILSKSNLSSDMKRSLSQLIKDIGNLRSDRASIHFGYTLSSEEKKGLLKKGGTLEHDPAKMKGQYSRLLDLANTTISLLERINAILPSISSEKELYLFFNQARIEFESLQKQMASEIKLRAKA